MNAQLDIFETQEVQLVRFWLSLQDVAVRETAALEVARMRVFDALCPFFSLLYVHSESARNAALSGLRVPSIIAAFEALELNPDNFASGANFEVRRLRTTRPDDYWRACGVGRPKGKK